MAYRVRSFRQEQAWLAADLRSRGRTWVQVAEVFRAKYRVNARVALRLARGWSQHRAAEEWNLRWPDDPKTLKNFSYWEVWPSSTGHQPSLDVLARLAELYQCSVADLVCDLPDFRNLDTALGSQKLIVPAGSAATPLAVPNDSSLWTTLTGLPVPDDFTVMFVKHFGALASADGDTLGESPECDHTLNQLVRLLTSWATTMHRREALRHLGWAATAAALVRSINPDELERVAAVLTGSSRLDGHTLGHIEGVLAHCRSQDWALGPHAVLDTVLAQRRLARSLLADCPAELRPRLLSVLGLASNQAGWLCFDLEQFAAAQHYYEDARSQAHEAANAELGSYVLGNMSQMAVWRGQPRTGIDHAVAAQEWVRHSGDTRLRAYTSDVVACAYAADGQRDTCLAALDTARATLPAPGDDTPSYSVLDETIHLGFRGLCHRRLGEGQLAADYAQQSLKTFDRSITRLAATVTVSLSRAYVLCNEIDEAARLLGGAGEIAATHSSARLLQELKKARADLQPWEHTTAIRTLDERLTSCGLS